MSSEEEFVGGRVNESAAERCHEWDLTKSVGVNLLTVEGVPWATGRLRKLSVSKRDQPPTPTLHLLAACA